jgi:hypothetical protein
LKKEFMPRRMNHFADARGGPLLRVTSTPHLSQIPPLVPASGVGRFKIIDVNPASDPGKAAKASDSFQGGDLHRSAAGIWLVVPMLC